MHFHGARNRILCYYFLLTNMGTLRIFRKLNTRIMHSKHPPDKLHIFRHQGHAFGMDCEAFAFNLVLLDETLDRLCGRADGKSAGYVAG
jgi:hypothetical protein